MFGALYFAGAYFGQAFPASGPIVVPVVVVVEVRSNDIGSPPAADDGVAAPAPMILGGLYVKIAMYSDGHTNSMRLIRGAVLTPPSPT